MPSSNPSPMIPNYAPNPNGDGTNLMTLDGFLRNVYGENPDDDDEIGGDIPLIDAAGAITAIGDSSEPSIRRKTADDVWREIVAGKNERKECKVEAHDEMMTLEDFLAKAGAVKEEDVKISCSDLVPVPVPVPVSVQSLYQPPVMVEGQVGGGGRGKRRGGMIMEPMDRVAQQRQKRMIKNRESAARSRERKQAYQVELESLAGKLEEENDQLQREKLEWTQERYKQLMENVVPVVEKKRPPRPLRRVLSMQW